MNRRQFLTAVASSGVSIAGCQDTAEQDEISVTSNYQIQSLNDGVAVQVDGEIITNCNNCYLPDRVEILVTILDDNRKVVEEREETFETPEEEENYSWSSSITFTGDDAAEKVQNIEVESDITGAWYDGERV